jgi:hypothetical protein
VYLVLLGAFAVMPLVVDGKSEDASKHGDGQI